MQMKKAILVEIGGSHTECLYSQVRFLTESGYDLALVFSENLHDRIDRLGLKNEVSYYKFGTSTPEDWQSLRDIKKFIITKNECKVIFNTAGGNLIRNLVSFHYPSTIEFIGVIHDLSKLKNSFTQKLINRKIKKYFVLNDYLKDNSINNISVESFYPVFFPDFKNIPLNKKVGEFWVCIPGNVEFSRRDYKSLVESLKKNKINDNVKFILLGSSGHFNSDADELMDKIKNLSLEKYFIFFDDFVPEELFHSYAIQCDLIMPLIHKSHPYFLEVDGYKISGNFNIAFAHKKPLLVENTFEKFGDFKENGIFYSPDNMISKINVLSADKNNFIDLKSRMYKDPKWLFEFQKEKYISFIEQK